MSNWSGLLAMMPVHESQTDFATAIESLQGAGPRPKIILKADGTLSPSMYHSPQ